MNAEDFPDKFEDKHKSLEDSLYKACFMMKNKTPESVFIKLSDCFYSITNYKVANYFKSLLLKSINSYLNKNITGKQRILLENDIKIVLALLENFSSKSTLYERVKLKKSIQHLREHILKEGKNTEDQFFSWKSLSDIFSYMIDEFPRELNEIIQNYDDVFKLCKKFEKKWNKAQKSLTCNAYILWIQIYGLNRKNILSVLEESLKTEQIDIPDEFYSIFSNKKDVSWNCILNIIRSLHQENFSVDEEKKTDKLKAWEEVILFMSPHKAFLTKECDGFGRCAFCWRFVPIKDESSQQRLTCHIHTHNTLNYKKILAVHKKEEEKEKKFTEKNEVRRVSFQPWLFSAANNKLKAVRMKVRLNKNNLPEGWENLWNDDILKLELNMGEKIFYDMEIINDIFPNVFSFVSKNGGNPCSEHDLISVLDPISEEEDGLIRKKHLALHAVIENNLMLYSYELCIAEILLSAYFKMFPEEKTPVC